MLYHQHLLLLCVVRCTLYLVGIASASKEAFMLYSRVVQNRELEALACFYLLMERKMGM